MEKDEAKIKDFITRLTPLMERFYNSFKMDAYRFYKDYLKKKKTIEIDGFTFTCNDISSLVLVHVGKVESPSGSVTVNYTQARYLFITLVPYPEDPDSRFFGNHNYNATNLVDTIRILMLRSSEDFDTMKAKIKKLLRTLIDIYAAMLDYME